MTGIMNKQKIMHVILGVLLLLTVEAFDDCPDKCQCSPAVSVRKQQNWMLMTHNNRLQWMVVGRGRNHHKLMDASKTDGRRMTCIGLTQIPQEIPSDVVAVTLYGDRSSADISNLVGGHYRPPNQLNDIPLSKTSGSDQVRELIIEGNKVETLTSQSFKDMKDLTKLSLQHNSLRQIPPNVFSDLLSVESIDLSRNKLTFLAKLSDTNMANLNSLYLNHNNLEELYYYDFMNMAALQELDLSFNRIHYFDMQTFHSLTELKQLDLESNKLSEVQQNWFRHNVKLETLNLANNNIRLIEGRSFLSLPSLKKLYLARNKLSSIDASIFEGLSSLTHLDISQNEIALLDRYAFYPLLSLLELDISENMIRYLDPTTFQGLDMLTNLDLNNNDILEVPNEVLRTMPNLTTINLSYNKLRDVKVGMFQNMSELREIHLDNNRITQVADAAFSTSTLNNLSKLGWLFLDSNLISRITSTTLVGTPFLRYLGFSNNSISEVHPKAFQYCVSLVSLDLESNNINTLSDGIFKYQTSLRKLNLANNNLKSLDYGVLNGLNKLIDLIMYNNDITRIDPGVFQSLQRLRILNLASNRLDWADMNNFGLMWDLHYLDLSHNLISDVVPAEPSLREKQGLRHFNLAGNFLSTMENTVIESLGIGGKIYIKDNPWRCDCQFAWIPAAYISNPRAYPDIKEIACQAPKRLYGIEVHLLTMEVMCDIGNLFQTTSTTERIPSTVAPSSATTTTTTEITTEPITTTKSSLPTLMLKKTTTVDPLQYNLGAMPLLPKLLCDKLKTNLRPIGGNRLLSSWHVSILHNGSNEVLCTGSRLDDDWFVTSASCIEDKVDNKRLYNYSAIIGSSQVLGKSRNTERIREIRRTYTHPEYRKPGTRNDVALVLMTSLSSEYRIYAENPCILSKSDLESSLNVFRIGRTTVSRKNNTSIDINVKRNKLAMTLCSSERYVCSRFNKVSPQMYNVLGAPVYARYGVRESDWALAALNTERTRLTKSGKTLISKHLPLFAYVNWFEHIIEQEARWKALYMH